MSNLSYYIWRTDSHELIGPFEGTIIVSGVSGKTVAGQYASDHNLPSYQLLGQNQCEPFMFESRRDPQPTQRA